MKYFLPLCFALFFASCASVSFSVPEAVTIPEDFVGISPDRTSLQPRYVEKLDEFGAVWVRSGGDWAWLEKAEGVWDFSYLDDLVDKAEESGKKVLMILCYDNPWLYRNNKEHRNLSGRELAYFLRYVEEIVGRYRGRVAAYEIWNEPNGWFWRGSNKNFFALSAATAKKVKEIDPDVTVLAGAFFRVTPRFVRGMFRAGAFDYADGISLHPYASDALHTIKQIDKLKKFMDEFNWHKPVWITEAGYATDGIYFSLVNLQTYPEYIIKTMTGLALRGSRNVIWYELMDEYNPGEVPNHWNPSQFFGLMYPNGEMKNGAEAFKLWSRYLPGAEYLPGLPLSENIPASITSLYFRRNGGTRVLLLWNSRRKKENIRLSITGASGALLHNIVSGGAAALGSETLLQVGRDPVFITWTGGEGRLWKDD